MKPSKQISSTISPDLSSNPIKQQVVQIKSHTIKNKEKQLRIRKSSKINVFINSNTNPSRTENNQFVNGNYLQNEGTMHDKNELGDQDGTLNGSIIINYKEDKSPSLKN
jgi:hypothetical protein